MQGYSHYKVEIQENNECFYDKKNSSKQLVGKVVTLIH